MNKGVPLKEELIHYYSLGYSMKEIGNYMDYSVGKIHKYFHLYNIKPREKLSKNSFAKIKISENAKNRPSPRKNVKLTNETKEKMSISKSNGIGKKSIHNGYVRIYFPDHPKSDSYGYILEHILIMECNIGRWLKKDEVVHHKNFVKNDNRIENLELMSRKKHSKMHMRKRKDDDLSTK